MHVCIALAFVFTCSVVWLTWPAVNLQNNSQDMFPWIFAVFFFFVLMKLLKFAVDQKKKKKKKKQTNQQAQSEAVPGHTRSCSPVPQCHVAEQKECQGFNVPRLYHSALSCNAAVHVVPTVCRREPTAPSALSQPHILAFWWLVAGFGLAYQCWDQGMQAWTHLLFSLDQPC